MIEPAVSVFLGFSLAMDALAVSVAMVVCSSLHFSAGPVIRVSGVFGLFQALMPLAGWAFAGRALSIVGGVDHWIAFGLLSFVGGRMILEATRKREECLFPKDPSRGLPLLLLAIGTSLDALAAGVSFMPLGLDPAFTSLVIGLVTFCTVAAGMNLANRIGRRGGEKAAMIGGVILIGIGLKILLSHLAV